MPRFIFWPSSFAGPVNGAEIPKRISLSVTPPTALPCPSGFEIGESAACCPGAGEIGACCVCAVADGAAPGAAAIPAAGTSALFADALFAVSRSDGSETCLLCEPELRGLTPSNRDFPKMANNATRTANAATFTKRTTSGSNPSSCRAGSPGSGSGLKDLICRFFWFSADHRAIDDRNRSASGVAGCSRRHLGAYLLSSESGSSSLGELMMITLLCVASDQIYLSYSLTT